MDVGERTRFIGPIVLAGFAQSILQGLLFAQAATYYRMQGLGLRDDWPIRTFVGIVFVLGSLQTAQTLHHVWQVTVEDQVWYVVMHDWQDPGLNTLVTGLVQGALTYRCYKVTHNSRLTVVLLSIGIALEMGAGIALLTSIKDIYNGIFPSFIAWMSTAVAVDLSICVILLYHLLQQRTGVRALDAILLHVAGITIESALPSLLTVIMSLVFYFYMDKNSAMFFFLTATGKFYCHALFTTLNSRAPLREQLDKHRARLGRISLHTSAFVGHGRHEIDLGGGGGEGERRTRAPTVGAPSTSTASAANTSLITPLTPTGEAHWRVDVNVPPVSIAVVDVDEVDEKHPEEKEKETPLRLSGEDTTSIESGGGGAWKKNSDLESLPRRRSREDS